MQCLVAGRDAAKFPTSSTAGQHDFIASPELFIGQLSAGKHEMQFITSPGTWGVDFDEFAIFTRDSK
jgi:hypothetical protein